MNIKTNQDWLMCKSIFGNFGLMPAIHQCVIEFSTQSGKDCRIITGNMFRINSMPDHKIYRSKIGVSLASFVGAVLLIVFVIMIVNSI